MCSFYILYSKQLDKFYVGHTCIELTERLRKHCSRHRGFTGKTSDWQVVYSKYFPDKHLAYARERFAKNKKSRKWIENLIAGSARPD